MPCVDSLKPKEWLEARLPMSLVAFNFKHFQRKPFEFPPGCIIEGALQYIVRTATEVEAIFVAFLCVAQTSSFEQHVPLKGVEEQFVKL